MTRDGQPAGLLTVHNVKEVPRTEWATTTAAQAMIPLERMKLPAMTDGQILGMLSRQDVISLLRTRRELGV